MLAGRAQAAAWYSERLDAIPELTGMSPDARWRRKRSWFVYVAQLPEGSDRDEIIHRLEADGVSSKPYMPVIHLQPFFRERFGYAPGDFPIAEDIAASLARTAVFSGNTKRKSTARSQLSNARSLAAPQPRITRMARFEDPQDALFKAINTSLGLRPAAVPRGHRGVDRACRNARREAHHQRGRSRSRSRTA